MCYVIVTWRGLAWLTSSVGALLAALAGLLSPSWLIGPQLYAVPNLSHPFRPAQGIFNRCTLMAGRPHCGSFNLRGFATDSEVFPEPWKAALFFLALGVATCWAAFLGVVLSCCFRVFCRKSLFSLAGAGQALAAVWLAVGMSLYPWGWGSTRVQRVCGADASAFYPADCTLGWAMYAAGAGGALCALSAVLSTAAERAAVGRTVQHHLQRGHGLICLPR